MIPYPYWYGLGGTRGADSAPCTAAAVPQHGCRAEGAPAGEPAGGRAERGPARLLLLQAGHVRAQAHHVPHRLLVPLRRHKQPPAQHRRHGQVHACAAACEAPHACTGSASSLPHLSTLGQAGTRQRRRWRPTPARHAMAVQPHAVTASAAQRQARQDTHPCPRTGRGGSTGAARKRS